MCLSLVAELDTGNPQKYTEIKRNKKGEVELWRKRYKPASSLRPARKVHFTKSRSSSKSMELPSSSATRVASVCRDAEGTLRKPDGFPYLTQDPHGNIRDGDGWALMPLAESLKVEPAKVDKDKKKEKDPKPIEYEGHFVPYGEVPTDAHGVGVDGKFHYNWYERSPEHYQRETLKYATEQGAYEPRVMKPIDIELLSTKPKVIEPRNLEPKDVHHHQLFWVIHSSLPDGRHIFPLSTIRTWKGKWYIDPRYGNPYFIREEKDEV